MFKKEECRKCGEKVSKKYDFCPHCGNLVNGNSKKEGDLGMLGRDDNLNEFEELSKTIFRGGCNNMLNKMIGSVMKMLQKEMEKEISECFDILSFHYTNNNLIGLFETDKHR